MQIPDKQLAAHLRQQKLFPVYLISGEVPLLVDEASAMLRKTADAMDFQHRELFFVESGFDWNKLQLSVEHASLFGHKKWIEIRNPGAKFDESAITLLTNFLNQSPPDKRLFITTNKLTAAQQKTAWYKIIDRHGVIITIRPVSARELSQWIQERLQKSNLTADRESIALLATETEGNLTATHQAIEKLRLLYPSQPITKKMMATVVNDCAQFNIFNLTEEILQGAQARVCRILQGLRSIGVEAPLILWAIVRELRTLYTLAWDKQRGIPLSQLLATQWSSRQRILEKTLTRLSVTQLGLLLREAALLDRMIKGIMPGNIWHALERLCLGMAGIQWEN